MGIGPSAATQPGSSDLIPVKEGGIVKFPRLSDTDFGSSCQPPGQRAHQLTLMSPRGYTPLRLSRPESEEKVRGPGANAKTQYAVQAVVHLARQEQGQVVSVSGMAG